MSATAHAGGFYAYAIPKYVQPGTDGKVIITMYSAGGTTGTPACNTRGAMAIDTNTVGGKAMYSQILLVQANSNANSIPQNSQGPLLQNIYGTGTCNIVSGAEDMQSFQVQMTGQF